MGATQEKSAGNVDKKNPADNELKNDASAIDLNAPAGSERSLGEESVRDGRPATDDSVVEAIDEEGPEITTGQLP